MIAPLPGDVRIELIGSTPIWEFMPSPLHQEAIDIVRRSIMPTLNSACACFHLSDAFLRLPDGSLRRPDIAIYCARPAVLSRVVMTEVPGAVLEILSPGGELKDLQLGPPHYLSQGVRDVIVIDPETDTFTHFRTDRIENGRRGECRELAMGCSVVP